MFPQRLKELRKRSGFSQKSLSVQLGVSQQAVGKWETGRSSPDPDTLARLAALLGTSIDDVSVKATTTEGLGFAGEGQGIACYAVCSIIKERA